jgi:hypothetical protein
MISVFSRLFLPLLAVATATIPVDVAVDRAQFAREENVTQYTVTETYKLRNSRFSDPAGMIVNVRYQKGLGKTYKVLTRTGPSFLQSAVLDRMLKEEEQMSRGDERKNALITSANYQMKLAGEKMLDGRLCDALELTPRRKSPHLLRGKAWVDASTHNLIRIEGKPAASLSFWAGTPNVVREYMEIGGFSFARRSLAVTEGFLLGRSELRVDYTDYHVGPLDAVKTQ